MNPEFGCYKKKKKTKATKHQSAALAVTEPAAEDEFLYKSEAEKTEPEAEEAGTQQQQQQQRHTESWIPVAVAETPMIIKNRVMRNELLVPVPLPILPIPSKDLDTSGRNRRRSSLSRGKRLSSRGTGIRSAPPHQSIDSREFYKHVDPEESDPIRLRQILAWSAKLVKHELLNDQSNNDPKNLKMYDAVITGLVNKSIGTSWYNRDRTVAEDAPKIVKAPHPDDAKNRAKIEALEEEIQSLLREEQEYENIQTRCREIEKRSKDVAPVDLQSLICKLDHEQHALLEKALSLTKEQVALDAWVKDTVKKFKMGIYERHDHVLALTRKLHFSQKHCDQLYGSLVEAYESERRKRQQLVEPMTVLRMLGGLGVSAEEK
ncbi:Mis12-Mtw1 protein family-domain-containing protein [Obelidium mucronatum]|nr:Mis12-Mtw1 protein family-domain-containing protein [Obelidium mucronatum]